MANGLAHIDVMYGHMKEVNPKINDTVKPIRSE